MEKRFFKLTNTFICADFPESVVRQCNLHDHKALSMIHVFVYDVENVKTEALKIFAEDAKKRRVQIILHCFTEKDRRKMRGKLKGVEKGKWFHLNLMKQTITIRNTPEHMYRIGVTGIEELFWRTSKSGEEYEDSLSEIVHHKYFRRGLEQRNRFLVLP